MNNLIDAVMIIELVLQRVLHKYGWSGIWCWKLVFLEQTHRSNNQASFIHPTEGHLTAVLIESNATEF